MDDEDMKDELKIYVVNQTKTFLDDLKYESVEDYNGIFKLENYGWYGWYKVY